MLTDDFRFFCEILQIPGVELLEICMEKWRMTGVDGQK